ncbi:MAG: hypothetical protein GF331_11065 [Chitinivibrionales bacterium]|nr:hypothetical protein [Chitinivibrionales bacterium]
MGAMIATGVLLSATDASFAQDTIQGGHSIVLTSPVNDEISEQVKRKSYERFKEEMLGWLEVHLLAEWEPRNGIDCIHLERFTRDCLSRAKQNSDFDGPKWVFSYALPAEAAARAAEKWNTRHDALAVQTYVQFKNAYDAGKLRDAYVFGIRTIYHARAHIGARETIAGESGKDFIYELSQKLKEMLDKLSISVSDAIVAGKPGFKPQKTVTITARIDSVALPSMKLSVVLHSGPQLVTVATDHGGTATLDGLIIPYVPNGSFFNIVPNPGAEIDESFFFTLEDLEVKLAKRHAQTMMFKIVRPTFALTYKARAVSDIVVPPTVSGADYLISYLKDSCHIDPAPQGAQPDIALEALCQVSGYEHEMTEKYILKSDMKVTAAEKTSPRGSTVQQTETYQRSYELGKEVPTGLYFWETARALSHLVQTTLLSL